MVSTYIAVNYNFEMNKISKGKEEREEGGKQRVKTACSLSDLFVGLADFQVWSCLAERVAHPMYTGSTRNSRSPCTVPQM